MAVKVFFTPGQNFIDNYFVLSYKYFQLWRDGIRTLPPSELRQRAGFRTVAAI